MLAKIISFKNLVSGSVGNFFDKPEVLSYCRLMRLPAVFSAMSNILAAYLIGSQGNIDFVLLIQLIIASACLYLGGMVLNDYYDVEEDTRERPNRPIPSGQISLKTAGILGYSLLASGILFAALAGTTQFIIAVILAVCIVAYDRLPKTSYVGIALMGSCRSLNWLLGLSVAPLIFDSFLLVLPLFFYICGLTTLSRVETSASSKIALYICGSGLLFSTLLIVLYVNIGVLSNNWPLVLLGVGLCLVFRNLYRTLQDFNPQNIQKSIMIMLMGVIPLDAILAFAGGPWWGGFLVVALWFPGKMLARRIYVT